MLVLSSLSSTGSPPALVPARPSTAGPACAQVLAAVLTIPLLMLCAGPLGDLVVTNVTNLFDESLVLATPIALGAMTGLWSERAGIINIGIEGMMLGAAGVGFMTFAVLGAVSSAPGSGSRSHRRAHGWPWPCSAIISIRYNVNQIVGGVVINLFALGLHRLPALPGDRSRAATARAPRPPSSAYRC